MFKVNNKYTRATSMTLFWCLHIVYNFIFQKARIIEDLENEQEEKDEYCFQLEK